MPRGEDQDVAVAPRRSASGGEAGGSSLRALSLGEIVETGLRLGLRDGFDVLSMRTLARELNVSTMALYHHVPNKRGLLVMLVDAVLAGIPVPPPEFGDWPERLRELNGRSAEVLSSFPSLDRVMFDMPPTPEGWRLMNGYVQILLDAGFPEREAALAFSVLHSYGLGRTTMERELQLSRERGDGSDKGAHPPMPALDRLNGYWLSLHRPAYRGFAIDVIIEGLRTILESASTGRSR
ncbi:MAG: putative transcriptional regulator of the TetR family [Arthrobacter sp.]|jgi:AcrR family transcriptional regulator|nr:putative transcriptional regulator of the TetR family [Arthrobacter sp.]